MEETIQIKTSELRELLNEIRLVKEEIREIREREEDLKAYSIQQTADMLNLHYTTVRRLVVKRKLFAKHTEGDKGRCTIPLLSIKEYLKAKKK